MAFGFNQGEDVSGATRQWRVSLADLSVVMIHAEYVGFNGAQVWFYNGPSVTFGLVKWFSNAVTVDQVDINAQEDS